MQNAATPSYPITASYDAQNRLLSATRGSGGSTDTMEVVYDPWNRPIYRVINGQKLFYVWDGWDLVGERTEAQYQVGEYERVYVHGAAVDEVLTMQQGYGGARKFHHHDALGSVIALTDDTGALVESYTYDVFGKPQVFDATGLPVAATQHGNRFLYTGREYIAELSLYDYRNRVYSAEIGRFLQTDPIGFAGGDINLYGYVGNGAADWSDPSGLSPYYPPAPPTNMPSGPCPPPGFPPIGPPPEIPVPPFNPPMQLPPFGPLFPPPPPLPPPPLPPVPPEKKKKKGGDGDQGAGGGMPMWARVFSSIPDMSGLTNFAAGFGDGWTFGLTSLGRSAMGNANTVNTGSGAYATGVLGGNAAQIGVGIPGGMYTAAGGRASLALHGAHHNFAGLGRRVHLQLNTWFKGVKGSGEAYRLPLPWWR